MLQFFLVSFGKVRSSIDREREFLADSAGAEASSALDMASALTKLELFAPAISAVVQELVYTDRVATEIAEQVELKWPSPIPNDLLDAQAPHPFDSHPPLGSRLENLNINLNSVLAGPIKDGAALVFDAPEASENRVIIAMRAKAEAASFSPKFTFVPKARPLAKMPPIT
jgi:hypothetical protein